MNSLATLRLLVLIVTVLTSSACAGHRVDTGIGRPNPVQAVTAEQLLGRRLRVWHEDLSVGPTVGKLTALHADSLVLEDPGSGTSRAIHAQRVRFVEVERAMPGRSAGRGAAIALATVALGGGLYLTVAEGPRAFAAGFVLAPIFFGPPAAVVGALVGMARPVRGWVPVVLQH